MLCSSHITSFGEDRLLFLLIQLTGVLCHLFKFFSFLSSFPSFSRSAAQIISILFLLYLVLTGVSCLFLSSSFSSYLILYHFSTGVLFEFGLPWSPSLTGVFSIYIFPFNLKVFRKCSLSLVSNVVFST